LLALLGKPEKAIDLEDDQKKSLLAMYEAAKEAGVPPVTI